jgi:uncharacterized coiled-coil protein SlyX
MADESRAAGVRALEEDAELLVLDQLDMLAQVEAQLRAVHHTMRRIEKLRAAKHRRNTPEPSNGERSDALAGLAEELRALDEHLTQQHACGREMQVTVERMHQRLKGLRGAVARAPETAFGARPDPSKPPDSSGMVGTS